MAADKNVKNYKAATPTYERLEPLDSLLAAFPPDELLCVCEICGEESLYRNFPDHIKKRHSNLGTASVQIEEQCSIQKVFTAQEILLPSCASVSSSNPPNPSFFRDFSKSAVNFSNSNKPNSCFHTDKETALNQVLDHLANGPSTHGLDKKGDPDPDYVNIAPTKSTDSGDGDGIEIVYDSKDQVKPAAGYQNWSNLEKPVTNIPKVLEIRPFKDHNICSRIENPPTSSTTLSLFGHQIVQQQHRQKLVQPGLSMKSSTKAHFDSLRYQIFNRMKLQKQHQQQSWTSHKNLNLSHPAKTITPKLDNRPPVPKTLQVFPADIRISDLLANLVKSQSTPKCQVGPQRDKTASPKFKSSSVKYGCEFCKLTFEDPTTLVRHQADYHNVFVNQKMHWCDLCGKKFKLSIFLEKHKVNKHGIFFNT